MTPWFIHLLGDLRAEREGQVLTQFRTRRAAALLGHLSLFLHRFHPRETVIELLWPETDPDAGRLRLRQELHALRRQLEPAGIPPNTVLIATRFGLKLNPDMVQTDVGQLERAVQRSRQSDPAERVRLLFPLVGGQRPGDLLPGLYDDWVLRERERLAALVDTAFELLTEARIALSRARAPFDSREPETSNETEVWLPVTLTRFFGRNDEIARIERMLSGPDADRLVTLTGPGGSGKTRLALEAARKIVGSFPAGVYFVPLAEFTDPARVPLAVQQALRLPPADVQVSVEDQVISVLASRGPTLLVVDNAEHLLTTVKARTCLTDFFRTLLERAPRVSILATSRRRFDLPGERILVADSLPLPSGEALLNDLAATPSIALFADRARSVRADFAVTERNAPALIEICHHLDGLPLALELAAARAAILSPGEILTQLTERFGSSLDLFTQGHSGREQTHRHRSLRAALQWSQDLLPPSLQRILARLSIFPGGWSAEIAGQVLEEVEITAALKELCASSLVRTVETEDGSLRFYLLETQREFAQRQLAPQERSRLLSRLARIYTNHLKLQRERYGIPTEPALLHFIRTEYGNICAALTWCLTDDLIQGIALAVQIFVFWLMRGQYAEGIHWLDALFSRIDSSGLLREVDDGVKTLYARLQVSGSAFLLMLGRPEEALARNERAAEMLIGISVRDTEAEEWLGWAYCHTALAFNARRDYTTGVLWLEKALSCMRRTPETRNAGAILYRLGQAAFHAGDLARAETWLQEAFTLLRSDDDYWQGYALALRAAFAIEKEDYEAARRFFEDSLFHLKRIPSAPQHADTEMELAILERDLGNLSGAKERAEKALHVFSVTGACHRAAVLHSHLALTALYAGDYDAATRHVGEAERRFEAQNEAADAASCLLLRGQIALERDADPDRAARMITRALHALRDTPMRFDKIPAGFHLLAECAWLSGDRYRAAVLLGVACGVRERQSHRARLLPLPQARFDRTVAQVKRAIMDPAAYDLAFAEGYSLSPEAAFALLSVSAPTAG
ncbi:MAG: AAA family ATPase [Capsulimonadales bacterium]|nr:AAA family ATPase [Capsulimonadales bacterium]